MRYIKEKKEFKKKFTIESEGFEYVIDPNKNTNPGDYGYLSPSYNDGEKGVIVKVTNNRTYPDAKDHGDFDSYNNCWNVEIINKSEIGKNKWDNKQYFSKSYHLSHFRSSGSGRIISTNNPNINL